MGIGPDITLNGRGTTAIDTDPTDEEKEEMETIGDIQQVEADPETFDRTFLATADDWKLGGPFASPAPFPLQVIPRMAYVINYSYIYNPDRDRWEPQKKGDLAPGLGAKAFQAQGTNQNLPGDTDTVVNLTDEDFSEDVGVDLAGDVLRVEISGIYLVHGRLRVEAGDDGLVLQTKLQVNGALQETGDAYMSNPNASSRDTQSSTLGILDLDEGDEVELVARTSLDAGTTIKGARDRVNLAVFKI